MSPRKGNKCTNPECPYFDRAVLFSLKEFIAEVNKPEFHNDLHQKEVATLTESLAQSMDLLRRNHERMKLINGSDDHCIVTGRCPNHDLMHDTEMFLSTPSGEKV